jgi:ketosteroid isomerase-like protein
VTEESTTPDLEELVRRLSAATSRRDLDSMMPFFAPDAVFDVSSMGFGTFAGRAAIRQALEDWWAAYEEYEFELVEFGDLGHGVTFGIARQRARPSGSTGSVELRVALVVAWDDGLIRLEALYTDLDEARAAAERLAKERA